FRLALALRHSAPRPLDVRARPRMAAVQKQRTRPDVDGVLILGCEVMVEADQQELLDLRVAIAAGRRCRGVARRSWIAAGRFGHFCRGLYNPTALCTRCLSSNAFPTSVRAAGRTSLPPWRKPYERFPASGCSTSSPTRRTTDRCSRWPETQPASNAPSSRSSS